MGRPPKPTVLKIAQGSYRADRARNEPMPPRGIPQRPEWLSDAAREQWEALVPMLDDMGVLTLADINALARYCTLWARWRVSEDYIAENGSVIKTPSGYPVQNPHVSIAAKLAVELSKIEQQFGLTPAARTRVQTTGPAKADVAQNAKSRFFKTGKR